MHVFYDLDIAQDTHRLYKLSYAISSYKFFLDWQIESNNRKIMFKKVFYVFVVISFVFSVLTVRWYSRKYTFKKEQKPEKPLENLKQDSASETGSDDDLTKESRDKIRSEFDQ